MKKMNKKGFTIVELVIVIAVIAILAAVMIPTFSGVVESANESKTLQDAKNAYTQLLVTNNGQMTEGTHTSSPYTFTVNANGVLTDVECSGYEFVVENGAIKSVEKDS